MQAPRCSSADSVQFPESYRAAIATYLMRRIALQSDLEDLVQEVCLRFLCAPCIPRDPMSYLMAIAKNVLAEHYGEVARRRRLFVDVDMEGSAISPVEACSDAFASIDIDQRLRVLLRKLPCCQRLVLIEHERYGYSYREVANRLGYSVQTVEKYLTLAKATLRAIGQSKANAR